MGLFHKKGATSDSKSDASTSTSTSQAKDTKSTKTIVQKTKFASPGSCFRIYGLFSSDDHKHEHPLYFADSEEHIREALTLYDFYYHYPHFKLWCELRNLVPDMGQAWSQYQQSCLADDINYADYIIVEFWYDVSDLASFLRIFSNCSPLATSFERPDEVAYYGDALQNHDIEESEIDKNMALCADTLLLYKKKNDALSSSSDSFDVPHKNNQA